MADYTLKIRRFDPESGEPAYWADFDVDLPPERSVLDGILQVKDREDASIAIRCSCRAAICGSCGVRINGRSALACNTRIGEASERGRDGVITVEPMGNMPVVKDLVTDMEAVHWKKVRRVVPWLVPAEEPPEGQEYIVPAEAMLDVTQAMACIHCGVCVSACLSLEVDPDFIGPAALAKAYRFVGDPRDGEHEARLKDLAEDPHGIYDCTHCFACVEVCPKDVAPMNQIMRLRRKATDDYGIKDSNNGYGHEKAFMNILERWGTLHEAQLLPRSFGDGSLVKGQTRPSAISQLVDNLPTVIQGLKSGKVSPKKALVHKKLPDQKQVKRIFDEVESKDERVELNLYIIGEMAGEEEGAMAEGIRKREAGVLARVRVPGIHSGAARLRGEGGPAAGPRAGRAGPRELLRRRRDRRAQPGAGRHPERTDVRDGTAGGGRRGHDEHLLHVPGRAVGVPGAPRRQRQLPSRGEQPPRGREPLLRDERRLVEQELPLDPGRGDRLRRPARAREAPARPGSASPPSTAATSCGPRSGSGSTSTRGATPTSTS